MYTGSDRPKFTHHLPIWEMLQNFGSTELRISTFRGESQLVKNFESRGAERAFERVTFKLQKRK